MSPAPGRPPGDRVDLPWTVPSWVDPVVRRATGAIGGPLGRHGVVGGTGLAGVAAAVTLLGTLALGLGVWRSGHCLMKGWSTPDQFWRACYSDLPVVHVSSPLGDRALPWVGEGAATGTPPLPGAVMWLIAQVSPAAGPGLAAQQWVFALWALLCVPLVAVAVVALVSMTPGRPWQAAMLAASPVLVLLAHVSTDLLGVTLMVLGLWAWQRDRPWLCGLLLGPAVLVRPFPLLVLVAIGLLAWRRGSPLPALQAVVGAALGALVVLVPLVAVQPEALSAAQQWWSQPAGYGALQMVPRLMGVTVPTEVTTAVVVAGWLAALGVGVWASAPGRSASRPELGVDQLAALMIGVVALTAASLSVQSGLWLLPFLALSTIRWSSHLVWAGAEALAFLTTWLHIAFASDPGRGLPPDAYALVVVLRAAAWSWILWQVVRTPRPGQRREPTSSPARTVSAS
ncbi:hypothetical protein [Serinicoccus kebangsaanensis]|uniref:hypothetical protein n=1 Tax=Serinicoccus kebangsaanensis TaxID=2602069 RepID=UPI00124F6D74|nr:hypothetical protein [Serinicoccus kebangsaanensis]